MNINLDRVRSVAQEARSRVRYANRAVVIRVHINQGEPPPKAGSDFEGGSGG